MIFLIIFLVLPALGVIWFINLTTFIEKTHNGKNTHNQKILGAVWTFLFIALAFFYLTSLLN